MSDDRSERLRQRRRQSREKGELDETDEQSEPSKSSKPSETFESGETDEQSEPSVKDERVGTYMYLAEEQKKDVNYLFGQIQNEYEYEYDEEFEKNRHFYPLLVKYGLEQLDSWDIQTVREKLQEGF